MALEIYRAVLRGERMPAFMVSRDSGDLDEKISAGEEILRSCHLCEWRCEVNRREGKGGVCGILEARVATEFIHLGEERELVPSHTIFFSGCNFRCLYCQNWDISQYPESGRYIPPEDLARRIDARFRQGTRNVNFVGGEPTPDLPYILKVLRYVESPVPVVWNSNMYLTEEGMNLLEGVVDLYLTDFKYGNDDCAMELSGVRNYFSVVSRNHLLASRGGDLLIRHLVLPGHVECCTIPILEWIQDNLERARINVMPQYRPEWKAGGIPGLDRPLQYDEYLSALKEARDILDPERFPLDSEP